MHKCPQKVQTTDKSVGLLVPVGTHHCAISCPQEMNTPTCLKSYLQSCDYSLLLNLAGNHYLLATFYFSEIVSCNKMSSAALSLTGISVDVITFPFSFKDCSYQQCTFRTKPLEHTISPVHVLRKMFAFPLAYRQQGGFYTSVMHVAALDLFLNSQPK